jgi:hypothetical protein
MKKLQVMKRKWKLLFIKKLLSKLRLMKRKLLLMKAHPKRKPRIA